MTNIHSAAQLAALLQSQLAGERQKQNKTDNHRRPSQSSPNSSRLHAPSDLVADLGFVPAESLTQIGALSATDQQLHRKAFRCFLQATLAQKLRVVDHGESSFEKLVDDVLQTMESDSELSAAMQAAGQKLVQLASTR